MKSNILEIHPYKISPEPMSGCWLWTAAIAGKGYGVIWFRGKMWGAHRVSFTLSCQEIPNGLHVLHKCDIPCCVNPAHLVLGSNSDNIADKVLKGRSAKGENNSATKLTTEAVLEIREILKNEPRYKKGLLSNRALATKYGVSEKTISLLRNRKTWKHI